MDAKDYKPNDNALLKEIRSDLEQNLDKFRDPVVLAEFAFRLLEERENTNRMLTNLVARIDALEAKLAEKHAAAPKSPTIVEEPMLPEIDQQIMEFIRERGRVTAEDVRERFSYRGKNAASARLNRLRAMGLLEKKQAGKKVYFFPE